MKMLKFVTYFKKPFAFFSLFFIILILFFFDLKLLFNNINLNGNIILNTIGFFLFGILLFVLYYEARLAKKCAFTGKKFSFLEKTAVFTVKNLPPIQLSFEGMIIVSEMQHLEILSFDDIRGEFYLVPEQAEFLKESQNPLFCGTHIEFIFNNMLNSIKA